MTVPSPSPIVPPSPPPALLDSALLALLLPLVIDPKTGQISQDAITTLREKVDLDGNGILTHGEITAAAIAGISILERQGLTDPNAISKALTAGSLTGIATMVTESRLATAKNILEQLAPDLKIEVPNATDIFAIQNLARSAAHAVVNSTTTLPVQPPEVAPPAPGKPDPLPATPVPQGAEPEALPTPSLKQQQLMDCLATGRCV